MKARIPTREIAEEAKFRKKSARNNDRFLNYAHRSIVLSIRDNAGFGADRMTRLIDGSYCIGRDYMERFSPLEKTDEDYAVDSYYAKDKQITDKNARMKALKRIRVWLDVVIDAVSYVEERTDNSDFTFPKKESKLNRLNPSTQNTLTHRVFRAT